MVYHQWILLIALGSHVRYVIAKPPNIVFVLADDYGFNDIGYHGQWHDSVIKTPVLDQLAGEGIKLENYYVQPICSPTRSQLMTGKYQIHTGLQHSIIWAPQPSCLPLQEVTLADKLKELGYATHAVGKWHLGFYKEDCWPTRRGFQSFFGHLTGAEDYYTHVRNGAGMPGFHTDTKWSGLDLRNNEDLTWAYNGTYSTMMFSEKAQTIIKEHDATKPLFLYIPFQAVHAPLQVPAQYIEPYSYIKDSNRRKYAGMVACMDEGIGNITQTLKDKGLWNDTLLVFSTDNGGQIYGGGNNWPLRGWKTSLWEGGIHGVGFITSPLLPKEVQGSVYDGLMHVSDWFPTLVEGVAGGDLRDLKLDGHNMWKSISGLQPSPRIEILHNIDPLQVHPNMSAQEVKGQSAFNTTIRSAIRVGDWKLITGEPGDSRWIAPPESSIKPPKPTDPKNKILWLFNIKDDPYEHNDLSELRPDIVYELYERLVFYAKDSVPVFYPPGDLNANPALHNNTWTNWV